MPLETARGIIMIFDTHAHYDDESFDIDREELLESMKAGGIGRIVNISAGLKSAKASLLLAERYDFIYASVGVHPEEIGKLTEADIETLREISSNDKVVAVGEVGLDYHYDEPSKELQKKWFVRQLELARDVKLPVIVHSRDAANDTLQIMRENHAEDIGGVVHCFSYGWDMAKIYLDMGFYLGIGGVVTFKNGKKLKEVVEKMPLERIVLETDAPYLAPEPNRGTRNTSFNLHDVVDVVAEIKGISVDEVERVTWDNACRMYGL